MTRDEFLSKKWIPYPPMPTGAVAWGRVSALNPTVLSRGGADHPVSQLTKPELLRVGDLVAIGSDGEWTLLAPCEESVPALTVETRLLETWGLFLEAVRRFFRERNFLETPTPGLVICPGTEPTLDVFSTELRYGSRRQHLYLPTSPELHLKKLLAQGLERIFEVKSVFRNGEITSQHQPEFTMLEWYRAWSGPETIRADAEELIASLGKTFTDRGARVPRKVERASMASLFRDVLKAEIRPDSSLKDYMRIAERAGVRIPPSATIDDVFFLIFLERIESTFEKDTLMVVEDWPPFQAALARLSPTGWADRFEIYWQGLELANAFHELNDPKAQRLRFQSDLEKKKTANLGVVPLDEQFLAALAAGMPPSAGIALGVERLFMAMFGVSEISQLRPFPYEG